MQRARDRDQRLVAGASGIRGRRICMETPAVLRIACAVRLNFHARTSQVLTRMESVSMPVSTASARDAGKKAATTATIVLAFASVYFFWGSTYTAIRIGAAEMPALLLAGTRFSIAGAILLAWCRWRGLRLAWPPKSMLLLGLIGLLLLGGGNVGLIYAEETVPSGLASLVFAVTPLYVALMEMVLPGGEPLPRRGWLGLVLGFLGLSVLVWPSLRVGLAGNGTLLWALGALLAGALSWSVGSLVSRHARLKETAL